jgi:hypothetical protein
MKVSFLLLACGILAFAAPISAQKFLDKPYTEWSKDEALKIASESAWAKTYSSVDAAVKTDRQSIARSQRDTVNSGGGRPGSVSGTLGSLPVTIRLHSSPLVRQAIVRLQQIAAKYDKMDAERKAAFDASKKGFLDCAICRDYYVVTITMFTDSSGETTNEGMFSAIKPEDIIGKVFLINDKGERRPLFQFNPAKGPGDSAVFYFKRTNEAGMPLIASDTKSFEFLFSGEFIQWDKRYGGIYPKKWDFGVEKLIVDGNVSF